MGQSLVCCHLHIVFSTKHRHPFIDEDLETQLYPYLGGILRDEKCVLSAVGGMPDHVHLLVSMGKEIAISDLVRTVKANSSKWIHKEFPKRGDFAWQTGYAAFSVSHSNRKTVKRYAENQKSRHSRLSFQDETEPGACAPGYYLSPRWGLSTVARPWHKW